MGIFILTTFLVILTFPLEALLGQQDILEDGFWNTTEETLPAGGISNDFMSFILTILLRHTLVGINTCSIQTTL
jgi:hypothetical protein